MSDNGHEHSKETQPPPSETSASKDLQPDVDEEETTRESPVLAQDSHPTPRHEQHDRQTLLQEEIDRIATKLNEAVESRALAPNLHVSRMKKNQHRLANDVVHQRGISPLSRSWSHQTASSSSPQHLPPLSSSSPTGHTSTAKRFRRSAPLSDLLFAIGSSGSQERLRDCAQQKQIELAEVLEEQRLVAERHKVLAAKFQTHCEAHAEHETEEREHQKAMARLKTRFKGAQVERVEAERRVQANHTRIHDLKVQLQRSRLKRTPEEEAAQKLYDLSSAELREVEECTAREERDFTMQLEVLKSTIDRLQLDIQIFDPVKFAEEEELRELEMLMLQKQLETQRNEVKAQPGGYGPGSGFASNATCKTPSPTQSVSPDRETRDAVCPQDEGATEGGPAPPEVPVSSIDLLSLPNSPSRLNRGGSGRSVTGSEMSNTMGSKRSRGTAATELEARLRRSKELFRSQKNNHAQKKAQLDEFLGKK